LVSQTPPSRHSNSQARIVHRRGAINNGFF
jgi:hypothetical protein